MKLKKVIEWAKTLDPSKEWGKKVNECEYLRQLEDLILEKTKEKGSLNLTFLLIGDDSINYRDYDYPLDLF